MKNKVMELLNEQKEARNILATTIVEQARELLIELGCENLLTVGTTIQEVEVIKEVVVSSDEDKKTIKELQKELKKANKLLEYNKGVNVTLRNEIKELKDVAPVEIIKEVEVIKEVPVEVQDTKLIAELNNQLAVKDSIIEALNEKIKMLEAKDKKSNAKIHAEETVLTVIPEGLKITKNFDTHIIGEYQGVAFEAMKNIEGTNIYDSSKWDMKEEINKVLVDAKLIAANRDIKDRFRVECELGSCHEIDDKKYMGYVVVDNKAYSYVFDTNHRGGFPCYIGLDVYLKNPRAKKNPCKNKSITAVINSLIDKHNENVKAFKEANAAPTITDFVNTNTDTVVVDENTFLTDLFDDAVDNNTTPVVDTVVPVAPIEDTTPAKTSQEELDEILDFGWED